MSESKWHAVLTAAVQLYLLEKEWQFAHAEVSQSADGNCLARIDHDRWYARHAAAECELFQACAKLEHSNDSAMAAAVRYLSPRTDLN